MSQVQKTLQGGSMDGEKVWVTDGSPSFHFASGDVYIVNGEGEYVYSELRSRDEKISINNILADRKRKPRKRA